MIIVQEVDRISSEIEEFQREEWKPADIEHFGRIIDWKKEYKTLIAKDNELIVGVLELLLHSGVMRIESLIVRHDRYHQGIGKQLVQRAEEIASKNKIHKIYLETGKSWESTKFYEALGYEKTADLTNHYENRDYVEYSKFL